MYQVYRVIVTGEGSNSHSLGIREESWELRCNSVFNSIEEAKEYVVLKNRANSILANYLTCGSEQRKAEIAEEFCFSNDKYLHERRYFLGECGTDPKIEIKALGKKIYDALKEQNIKVVKF